MQGKQRLSASVDPELLRAAQAAVEAGIAIDNSAMSGMVNYNQLIRFEEV